MIRCTDCGLIVVKADLTSQKWIHVPVGAEEVRVALGCPSYGNALPYKAVDTLDEDVIKERILTNVTLRRWEREWNDDR